MTCSSVFRLHSAAHSSARQSGARPQPTAQIMTTPRRPPSGFRSAGFQHFGLADAPGPSAPSHPPLTQPPRARDASDASARGRTAEASSSGPASMVALAARSESSPTASTDCRANASASMQLGTLHARSEGTSRRGATLLASEAEVRAPMRTAPAARGPRGPEAAPASASVRTIASHQQLCSQNVGFKLLKLAGALPAPAA